MEWEGNVTRIGKRGNLTERNPLKDLGLKGRRMLKWIFNKQEESADWIDLAQDKDRWQTLLN
jgi:hypothetical protein